MESQAAIFRFRAVVERNYSEGVQPVLACRAAAHHRVAEFCRTLSDRDSPKDGSETKFVDVKSQLTDCAVSIQVSKVESGTCGAIDLWRGALYWTSVVD